MSLTSSEISTYVRRMTSAVWADYTESYASMLRALACMCDYVARCPSDSDFSRILSEARSLGLLEEEELATMCMVNRSTANRWINGKCRPSPLEQRAILRKLAALLRREIGEAVADAKRI